ncbi:PREDICTED: uncharacterized protein LOC106904079 [Poecilia mexicana]|uniref:uncharacterized protein LOC106904079 n=1 Tax=Poecilia mexicana TaxID=48701 RepID=UPI00072ED269|nr:PREDICTED: uncharacterized protein LOC106904079 [Poecilia mexicana]
MSFHSNFICCFFCSFCCSIYNNMDLISCLPLPFPVRSPFLSSYSVIEPTIKEAEATRRFSLTSSLASSSSAMRRTKGPLSASIKSKRHEIKSDPTPFGYEDTLCGAMTAGGKRQSMTSSIAGGSGGKAAVPRSTSQPGWTQRRLLSMDTEDFETIPSSGEESSNSSEDEANNKNGGSSRYRVQLTYASCEAKDLQFLEEGENGN